MFQTVKFWSETFLFLHSYMGGANFWGTKKDVNVSDSISFIPTEGGACIPKIRGRGLIEKFLNQFLISFLVDPN